MNTELLTFRAFTGRSGKGRNSSWKKIFSIFFQAIVPWYWTPLLRGFMQFVRMTSFMNTRQQICPHNQLTRIEVTWRRHFTWKPLFRPMTGGMNLVFAVVCCIINTSVASDMHFYFQWICPKSTFQIFVNYSLTVL